jgi:hypothetical protein
VGYQREKMAKVKILTNAEHLEWDDEAQEWTDGGRYEKWYQMKDLYNILCMVAAKKDKLYKKCPVCYGRKMVVFKKGDLCMQCGYDKELDASTTKYRKAYQGGRLPWQENNVSFEEFCQKQHNRKEETLLDIAYPEEEF